MADSTIPNLDVVITPAGTDEFSVRQSGDTRDKKQTRAQLHTFESSEKLLLDPGTLALPGRRAAASAGHIYVWLLGCHDAAAGTLSGTRQLVAGRERLSG